MNPKSFQAVLHLEQRVREAASFLPQAQQSQDFEVNEKANRSLVTECDLEMERRLRGIFEPIYPSIWSEETTSESPFSGTGFIFDPIDGTASFVAGREEYSVMCAFVEAGEGIWGLVHQPACGVSWLGHKDSGAIRIGEDGMVRRLELVPPKKEHQIRLLVSRDHPDALAERIGKTIAVKTVPLSSTGLKMMAILEGRGDMYINMSGKLGPWDLAGPMTIFELGGGIVATAEREDLLFHGPWAGSPPLICGHREQIIQLSELELI